MKTIALILGLLLFVGPFLVTQGSGLIGLKALHQECKTPFIEDKGHWVSQETRNEPVLIPKLKIMEGN